MKTLASRPAAAFAAAATDGGTIRARVLLVFDDGTADVEVGDDRLHVTLTQATQAVRPTDDVLVLTASDGAAFAVAALTLRPEPNELRLAGGAVCRKTTGPEGERLALSDRSGRVIAEYDGDADRLILHAGTGDLLLAAPAGRVDIVAGAGLGLTSAREVSVDAPALRTSVSTAVFEAGEVTARARSFSGTVAQVRSRVDKLVQTVGRMILRSDSLFQTVEGTADYRAGTVRTVVAEGFDVHADHVTVAADDDVKVVGERIHLG